jgi:hypothetical protein
VIATGFGQIPAARAAAPSVAQTPVDMTAYADAARPRPELPPLPVPAAMPRLSLARRPLLDLPLAAGLAATAGAAPTAEANGSSDEPGHHFDLEPAFDVPAFLRRQEG